MRNYFYLIFVIVFVGWGCKEKPAPLVVTTQEENLTGTFIGDSIIYNMIIKNVDPDDEWAEKCLRNLNRDKLISIIFDAVYNKLLIPYDFYTNEPIKLSRLRKLEKEFARDNIGKLQFVEEWTFDETNLQLNKRVNSVLLAYEVFNSAGEVRGYKPAFYVRLN